MARNSELISVPVPDNAKGISLAELKLLAKDSGIVITGEPDYTKVIFVSKESDNPLRVFIGPTEQEQRDRRKLAVAKIGVEADYWLRYAEGLQDPNLFTQTNPMRLVTLPVILEGNSAYIETRLVSANRSVEEIYGEEFEHYSSGINLAGDADFFNSLEHGSDINIRTGDPKVAVDKLGIGEEQIRRTLDFWTRESSIKRQHERLVLRDKSRNEKLIKKFFSIYPHKHKIDTLFELLVEVLTNGSEEEKKRMARKYYDD